MRDHFIFDMDGVLVDSEPGHQQIFKKVFKELNLDFSVDYHQTLVGMAAVPMWEKIRHDFQLQTGVRELVKFHREFMFVGMEQLEVPLIEGVVELLNRLEEMEIKMALASSSAERLINHFVDTYKIRSKFDFLVSGESLSRSKPFPDIFLKVADLYQQDPKRFLVIEDSENGVRAAKAAKMKCLGYANPNSGNQDLSLADEIITDFNTLTKQRIKEHIAG